MKRLNLKVLGAILGILVTCSAALASDEPFRSGAYNVKADVDGNPSLRVDWGGYWGLGVFELPQSAVAGSSIKDFSGIFGKLATNDWNEAAFKAKIFNSVAELESSQYDYSGFQTIHLTAPTIVSTDWGTSDVDDLDELKFSGTELQSIFAPQPGERHFVGIYAESQIGVFMAVSDPVIQPVDYAAWNTHPSMTPLSQLVSGMNNFAIKGNYQVVPEPASIIAVAVGLMGVARARRRRS